MDIVNQRRLPKLKPGSQRVLICSAARARAAADVDRFRGIVRLEIETKLTPGSPSNIVSAKCAALNHCLMRIVETLSAIRCAR